MAGRGSAPGERRGGRQKGTPNKVTLAKEAAIAASGLTPLEYLLSVLRDPFAAAADRFEAAKAAAPYCHARLATVAHTGPNGGAVQVQQVPIDELAQWMIGHLIQADPAQTTH